MKFSVSVIIGLFSILASAFLSGVESAFIYRAPIIERAPIVYKPAPLPIVRPLPPPAPIVRPIPFTYSPAARLPQPVPQSLEKTVPLPLSLEKPVSLPQSQRRTLPSSLQDLLAR